MVQIATSETAAARFPEQPFTFQHDVAQDHLLSVAGLSEAAEELPGGAVEYVVSGDADEPPRSIVERIAAIDRAATWMIFRNLERLDRYRSLMNDVLDALSRLAPWTGVDSAHRPMCFVFLSSPRVITPFHIDPEHNFLMQIAGEKTIFINDPVTAPIISPAEVRAFYADEVGYQLEYRADYELQLEPETLRPGMGVYIPVAGPHHVINGDRVSVSLSVTFRSAYSDLHRSRHLSVPHR